MQSTSGAIIVPKTLNGENDIDTLCLQAIHDLMTDGASRIKRSKLCRTLSAHGRTREHKGRHGLDLGGGSSYDYLVES